MDNAQVHRNLLEEVLERLPDHDLSDRIDCSSTPTSSNGGFSDIYLGTFKDNFLRDSMKSTLCLVCRCLKETSHDGDACNRCASIWDGKLAIKKIRVHVTGRDHSKAIARELYVFSRLSHPNILPFTGFLMMGCFPAIVAPWVEKGSLWSQIQSGQLGRSQKIVLFIARGIADGLAYLHEQNIIHCDLKSPNILLSSDETPLIADFGASRFIHSGDSLVISQSGASPATLRWSAPELFYGSAEFKRETDVWAFGMVLYELITHKLPFFEQALDMQVILRIISGYVPEWPAEGRLLRVAESRMPSALRDLCKSCWSWDGNERPTMQDVGSQLHTMASVTLDEVEMEDVVDTRYQAPSSSLAPLSVYDIHSNSSMDYMSVDLPTESLHGILPPIMPSLLPINSYASLHTSLDLDANDPVLNISSALSMAIDVDSQPYLSSYHWESDLSTYDMDTYTNMSTDTQNDALSTMPRPNVMTPATADASHHRRRAEATFVCPIPGCGSTFIRHFNLKGHLRSHDNDERPFKCSWPGCGKAFARQDNCKLHERLHLDIRPYTCQGCMRLFARRDALNRHLRSDAGIACRAVQPLLTDDPPSNPEIQISGDPDDVVDVISRLSEVSNVAPVS